MKTIIAGSRKITDLGTVIKAISQCGFAEEITEVVSGTARGVDMLGEAMADANGIPVKKFPANWKPNGVFDKGAGYKRNVEMGEYADALIAVWDGESRGTKHMIDIMKGMGKKVYVYKLNKWEKK
jgi:hypothetical protein